MKPSFRLIAEPQIAEVQLSVRQFIDALDDSLGGRLLLRRTIGTTTTTIAHYMKTVPNGWTTFSPEGNATIWQAANPDATFIYLIASAAVVTGIRVF